MCYSWIKPQKKLILNVSISTSKTQQLYLLQLLYHYYILENEVRTIPENAVGTPTLHRIPYWCHNTPLLKNPTILPNTNIGNKMINIKNYFQSFKKDNPKISHANNQQNGSDASLIAFTHTGPNCLTDKAHLKIKSCYHFKSYAVQNHFLASGIPSVCLKTSQLVYKKDFVKTNSKLKSTCFGDQWKWSCTQSTKRQPQ